MPFYAYLLPLLCGTCSFVHHGFPGDENGMWLAGSAPGLWIAPFVFLSKDAKAMAPLFIALALAAVMFIIGLVMDRFRIHKGLWAVTSAICALIVFALSILSFPSVERAINKNGSWCSYILFSFNAGMYLSVVLMAIITVFSRMLRMIRNIVNG